MCLLQVPARLESQIAASSVSSVEALERKLGATSADSSRFSCRHYLTCGCVAGADGLKTQVISAGALAQFARAPLPVGMLLTALAGAGRARIRAGRLPGARARPPGHGGPGRRRPCPRPLTRPPERSRGGLPWSNQLQSWTVPTSVLCLPLHF